MRRITPKGRIDTLTSEPRLRRPGRSGRITYLVRLMSFFVYVFDLVFGSLFYLSANGMLMRESSILSPDYTGTVAEISTREGAEVAEGAQLLRLDSLDVTAQIATSTIALGRLQSDLMERIERRETVIALIPEAESRRAMLLQAMEDVARLRSEGLAAATRESDAVNEYYAADRDLAVLLQEEVQLDREIPQVGAFVTEANDALAELQDAYDEGRIIAPIGGTIGELSVDLGEVVERGAPLLRVFHGAPYVLAYVPPGRLFSLQAGQRVAVRAGFVQLGGQIETVYPIAPALPPEFSLAFDSTQRQQLIKIVLDGQPPQSMPLFSTVRVTGPWNPVSRAMALINRLVGAG
jgi:multidrug resistance efflux pump